MKPMHRTNALWQLLATVALLACLSSSTAQAHAVNYKVCLSTSIGFDHGGNNVGYDVWNTISTAPLASSYISILEYPFCDGDPNGVTLKEGYLGADGCITFSSTYHSCVDIWWLGLLKTNGNVDVTVLDNADDLAFNIVYNVDLPENSATITHTFADSRSTRLAATMGYIINQEFRGDLEDAEIYIHPGGAHCDCTDDAGNWACERDGKGHMCIVEDRSQYIIAHEYGHVNQYLTSDTTISTRCNSAGGNGHTWNSQEYQSCALTEGWADFVAADVWNDHDVNENPDGFLYYPDVSDNCEDVNSPPADTNTCLMVAAYEVDVIDIETSGCYDPCVNRMMEARYASTTWPGRSTQLDWLRTFWDYHTNDTGVAGSIPSHSQMQREWNAMFSVSNSNGFSENTYDRFRQGVAANSGCAQYERLVYYAAASGTAHCDGSCDNVAGCTDCDSTCCGQSHCP